MKTTVSYHRILVLIACLSIVFSPSIVHAQWTESNGPQGEFCYDLIENAGVLYAGTNTAGVMKSTDSARTWVDVNAGLTDTAVYSLVFKGTVLYAGTPSGLYSSTNVGTTWTKVSTFTSSYVFSITTDGTRLYAGTRDGIYISSNNGTSWTKPTSVLGFVIKVKIIGSSVYACTIDNYMYKSTDFGATWLHIDSVNNGLNCKYVNAIANVGSTLFAGTYYGSADLNINKVGLYRSTNNGLTWVQISKPTLNVVSLISIGSTLYVSGYEMEVYSSKDNGATWQNCGLKKAIVRCMVGLGSKLYAGTSPVLYADTNSIMNYKPASLTLPAHQSSKVSVFPTFRWIQSMYTNEVYLHYGTSPANLNQSVLFPSSYPQSKGITYTPATALQYNTKYYWRVVEYSRNVIDSSITTLSSDTFSFTTIAPFDLTYPNGGEVLASGDTAEITWQGTTNNDTLAIYYTANNIDWQLISTYGVDEKFRWRVPKAESGRCKVRIIGGSGADTSDRFFTISIPKGTASAIDFGQTTVGTTQQKTMLCLSTGLSTLRVQEVLFEKNTNFFLKGISRSKDSSIIDIAFSPTSVGTFGDKVFIITQAGDTIMSEVKGTAVAASQITITYPNGNEILTAKDTVTVRWRGVAADAYVRLEYSDDSGSSWHVITDEAVGLEHVWTVPKIESDKCLLRAIDGVNGLTGEADTTFKSGTGVDGYVVSVAKQSDGKILVGGHFNYFNGIPVHNVARLFPNGKLDTTFRIGTGFDTDVRLFTQQKDGKLLVAGNFTTYNSTSVHGLVRLNLDGSLDPTFAVNEGVDEQINSMGLQSDGKIVIIGQFTKFGTKTANRIARLLPDGTLDNTFQSGSGFSSTVDASIIDDDFIYLAGNRVSYNGSAFKNGFKLLPNGVNDTTYKTKSGFDGWIQYASLQSDKKILYSGGIFGYDGFKSINIVRLLSDGSVDSSFVSLFDNASNKAYGTTSQNDGKIYISGSFTSYDNSPVSNFVRVFPDGKYDPEFTKGSGFNANTLGSVLNNDYGVIVYGLFNSFNGVAHNGIIQLFTKVTTATSDTSDALFAISIPKGISTTLDFGKTDTNTNNAKDITLTNTGKVPLALTLLQNTQGDPFSTQDTAKRVIPAGKDTLINISFIPTAVSVYADTMKWVTIAGDTIVSTMRGEGIASKPGVRASFTSPSVSMCRFTDTLLTVKVTGGTPPFQFAWRNKDGSVITPSDIRNGGTPTDSTISVSPSSTVTYRVIVTDSKSQRDTALVDIFIKNRPTPKLLAKGGTTICQGDSALIEVLNEATYSGAPLWSTGSIGATLWVKTSGVYFCSIDSNGCVGSSDSIKITVNPTPSIAISQAGNELIATPADTYQWLASDGTPITGATSQKYAPPADGTYSVRGTINGCSATSPAFTFVKVVNTSKIVVFDLNFGQQVVSNIIGRNAPLRNSIKVLNDGTIDRIIDSIIVKNTVFSLKKNALPRLIPPGVTVSFNIDFTPSAIGVFTDDILVYSGREIIRGSISGEGIALPSDGVITEIELVPNALSVSPGDTLQVYLRIKDEQPQASKATKFIANMQYDSRVLQWLPRSRQYNDEDSKRTNYWSLNVQEKRRFQGNPRLDTLMFLVKLADVDSTSLIFNDSTAFIWTDANGKVFPACRDSIVYIKVCKDGGTSQLIRFATPDVIKQVAPNPSGGTTTVSLSIGIAGACTVTLLDIFGRVHDEVVYPFLPSGDHILKFDNSSIENGTYYLVMKTGYNVTTHKLSIVK
ncbi:MAG: choice-of-anchor D domain-containing protein [Candidatus Kapaibacterium sp.]